LEPTVSDVTTSILYQKGYRIAPDGSWYKPAVPANRPPPSPEPEQAVRPGADGPVQGEASDTTGRRLSVKIVSYRTRLIDPDNLAGGCKFFIDALRYLSVIPDDTAKHIELTVSQVKVHHYIDEYTEITIDTAS
jgi:hypothetical protein